MPFFAWLAETSAVGDRYFSSSLGGTWSNRNFQYTGAAHGVQSTFDAIIDFAPTLFEQLSAAGIDWSVYLDVLGFRVPLFVVSPWVKPGYVSHAPHSHTLVLRFVQLLDGLPALTDRDATSSGLLDFFELDCAPDLLDAPAASPSGCDRRGL